MAEPRAIPPRLLSEDQAAEYLGIPKAEIVRQGIGRVPFGRYVRYDRRALDAHLDALSGLASQSANDDTPDAAFDRFLRDEPARSA
ncbi:helix-turn-helix domain-containing protein [Brevundimonas sp. Root1279]|uniref:helix-turn-helix domain-containing protein n=1 Tax=Brevundimonas sp. Root1279 TaxID=1736443 RepID=UPI0006F4C3B6|nr:helix-turn-helix domain-containing protein [Brevundimonas sp. Root1279]KQW79757.1 hypothetical protein ASC65_14515 [Brevundimonas sp. Root1279]